LFVAQLWWQIAACTAWKCTKACIKQRWNGIRFAAWLWIHDVLCIVLYIKQIVPGWRNALRGKADKCDATLCIWPYCNFSCAKQCNLQTMVMKLAKLVILTTFVADCANGAWGFSMNRI
jgi:hypothetical protein